MLGPWLHQRHLCMTYAPTGVGKSMFTMAVALAVAGAGSYLGWRTPKARSVLLVDGEMDVLDLKERARMLLPTIEGIDENAAARNLQILAQQAQGPGVKFPDLADETGRDEILRTAERYKAELVILDNFSTLATVEDENSASSFDPVLNLMLELKQAGRACILVHHARKGSAREGAYRGTSKMGVVFNSIIALSHPGGIPSTTGTAFELQWEKFRSRRDDTMQPLKVALEGDLNGPLQWTHEVSENFGLVVMMDQLRSLKYPTQKDLANALKIAPGTLSKWKGRAIAQKLTTEREWDDLLRLAGEQVEQEVEPSYSF